MKSRGGKSQRRDRKKREDQRRDRSEERRCRCTKRSRKIAKQCVFPMICGSGGSKSTLAKAGAEPFGGMRDENCMPLWHEAHLQVKMNKNTLTSEHFWKLRCWKSVRLCGAKHIWKSKCKKHQKTHHARSTLEGVMLKKRTPLLREAQVEVEMQNALQCRSTFGSWKVEKVHAVVARTTFRSQNAKNKPWSGNFCTFGCRFA